MIGLDSIASERLCLTLLHSLWQVALLALAAWGIGRCLGRHRENASYVVHATALVGGLIAAPITHAFLSWGGSTPFVESTPLPVAVASVSADAVVTHDVSQLPPELATAVEADSRSLPAVPIAQATRVINADPGFAWQSIMPWLAGAYLFGVVLMLARLARSAFLLERLRAAAQSVVDGPAFNALANICSQWSLKTAPVLAHAEQVVVPKVVGLLKPTILLPSSVLTGLPIDDLELILAHELAHVRRHDLWINLLQRLAEAVLFFNPAMWWLSRRVSTLREYCCDDRACAVIPEGAKPQLRYAEALLHAVELQHTGSSEQVAALAATGRSPSELRRRVARLFGEQIGESIRLSRSGIAVLLSGATLLLVAPTVADSSAQDKQSADSVVDAEVEDRAESAEEIDEAPKEADADLREMRIRILDEAGEPLPGARLYANRARPESAGKPGIINTRLVTDEAGSAFLPIHRKQDTVKLWAGIEGYVPEFVWLKQTKEVEEGTLPARFDFRLARGTRIGGRVVDNEGKPIAGVTVRVRVDFKGSTNSVEGVPRVDSSLSDGNTRSDLVTDAAGRWELTNAPEPDEAFRYGIKLKLSHPDYITDEHWGDAQRAQGVTTGDLRDGDAPLVLHRGKPITGVVTDVNGDPVARGWVVWSDTPYVTDGVYEVEIAEDGSFKTPPLADGEHPITIVAPGYAAQRRVVQVETDSNELRFKLMPGKRVEIRFVDKAGDPIPKAWVSLAGSSSPTTWNGSNALHNHKHSNVPYYGIPRSAGEDGVFIWKWAPEEPVNYKVGARGFAEQEVSLVAKSEPHVITLADARVVIGRVTDATTGEPIKSFQAMPVIVFGPNFFCTRYSDTKQGVDGKYELPLTGSADPEDPYRVRFEADGYRSVVSKESFGPQDGRVELNIPLEPAAAREGRVVNAHGEPVAGAMVLEGTPTWVPSIYNGEPDSYGERIVRTDSDGRFQLNATTEPVRVRVLHDKGTAETHLDPADASIGDVPLQPWAKISGRLLQEGQPVGNQRIYFGSLVPRGLGEARFQGNAQTLTAADGTFSFERVPPGAGSMRVALGPWRDSPLTSAKGLPIALKPGEERQIVLGGEGAIITGRVVATGRDEAPLNRKWSLNYLVKRNSPSTSALPPDFPELSFDPVGQVQPFWTLDPHFSNWVATRENHFVKLTPEGDVRITGVSPGQYDLVLRLYEQPAGCLVETVGEKIVPVSVEGDGTIDLGQIAVPCRSGPRVGSDMRAYEFVDASGRKKTINDMAGQHVVLHVWATWCGPCLTSMPDVAATVEQLDGKPITFVGLNIDSDRDGARDLAMRRGWNWAHNYLGDDSDLAHQLAISSVPTYYLIGPNGRLVEASTEWKSIRKAVADELLPRVSLR